MIKTKKKKKKPQSKVEPPLDSQALVLLHLHPWFVVVFFSSVILSLTKVTIVVPLSSTLEVGLRVACLIPVKAVMATRQFVAVWGFEGDRPNAEQCLCKARH